MNGLIRFLKERWLVWVIPLVLLLAVLAALAWKISQTSDNPFIYDVDAR